MHLVASHFFRNVLQKCDCYRSVIVSLQELMLFLSKL